jgi:hypothetical protein
MSNKQDEKLEEMLRSRRIESASSDLAQRIILQARQTPQLQPVTLLQWLGALFSELHLRKPAYVLAGTLLLGIVVGLNTPVETSNKDDPAPVNVQSFLYTDEALL